MPYRGASLTHLFFILDLLPFLFWFYHAQQKNDKEFAMVVQLYQVRQNYLIPQKFLNNLNTSNTRVTGPYRILCLISV